MKNRIVIKLVAISIVLTALPSCNLLHNQNDWAMGKGSSPRYVPKQVGRPETGLAVRGGN